MKNGTTYCKYYGFDNPEFIIPYWFQQVLTAPANFALFHEKKKSFPESTSEYTVSLGIWSSIPLFDPHDYLEALLWLQNKSYNHIAGKDRLEQPLSSSHCWVFSMIDRLCKCPIKTSLFVFRKEENENVQIMYIWIKKKSSCYQFWQTDDSQYAAHPHLL